MQIGPVTLANAVILAPMAGVADRPFRQLCRRLGAGLAVAEMVAANSALWDTPKSRRRLDFADEPGPIAVQILGSDPRQLAEAARRHLALGADIIDINMGCPVKKVCRTQAGAALLRDQVRVGRILAAVVAAAAPAPVTLKIRTGWSPAERNAVAIARIAEDCGIAALTIHGRTRACGYREPAEHETLRQVREQVALPLIANGDIDSPEKARQVLDYTEADAIMIGRAAQGRPWICGQIAHYLADGVRPQEPTQARVREILATHLDALYGLYGSEAGVRIARKHLAWYGRARAAPASFLTQINGAQSPERQLALVEAFFSGPGSEGKQPL
ncbi:tRNA dihydrouridine synthase DusB [Thiococcus pfennigii]|jgi:tRNA-dihydrouridine synthase B|uniref:tRNA dihydrouridine synthase DusB n=1 Tax=Thiococcus pfennigii TaxID=1057 RepID=UPI0019085624|nr:tRNA dihydrouridine synthase DusB [Thiococcus pfennigii]MBK1701698.1 tRNA dihydrouridine synthase DusB [Thiococcus pfennigii]MBK1732961.1 tRNA dihydrouridine synthase DusB [Thiococcus pfennigii]